MQNARVSIEDEWPWGWDVRLLRDVFATRLAHALSADDYAAVFTDPEQRTLFPPDLTRAYTVRTALPEPVHEDPLSPSDETASEPGSRQPVAPR